MTRTLLLLATLTLAAGCRSDGGFGRSSSPHDLAWATGCMAQHAAWDWETTKQNLASIIPGIQSSFSDGWREMGYTMDLYLENHQAKAGYARYDEKDDKKGDR